MNIEVLICTIDNNIKNVCNVLREEKCNVKYLISWQNTSDNLKCEIPQELRRDDVRIITIKGKGLSKNRNNAIKNATGDICLIADDDISYENDAFDKILELFERNPDLDIATFRIKSQEQSKKYPSTSFPLNRSPRFYYVCSIEIAFRRSAIQETLWFNELLGLGAPVAQSGEENLFIINALKLNLNCRYFPLSIVYHDGPTTSENRAANPGTIIGRGVLIRATYPHSYELRYLINAYRISKQNGIKFLNAYKLLRKGGKYAMENGFLNFDMRKIKE